MRGTVITLLATGISLLASVSVRNRNNMGMWQQMFQSFSPKRNNKLGMPVLLVLGVGFVYILTRTRNNIGVQQMMQPITNMRKNRGMWQIMQPFTNIMKNKGMQGGLDQQNQYDGQAMNDEMTIEEK